jgi:hypothetical protein
MHIPRRGTFIALAVVLWTSPMFAQSARPIGMTDEELFGTVIKDSKWLTLPIAVCWENPTPNDARYRAITIRSGGNVGTLFQSSICRMVEMQ